MADSFNAGLKCHSKCQSCGAAVDSKVTAGLCPACLLRQVAFGTGGESLPSSHAWLAPTLAELEPLFPQYEMLELIGQGGMGAVYKARQRSLGRLIAVKVLAPELASNPDFAERFTREARALAEFNHPNIVTIYDFGKAGSLYFLTMEFVDGVNLRQAMSTGRLTPPQALAIVPPVCEALLYAHQHGVVHRDIKPENLLLDKEGRLKIADFGIARMLRHEAPAAGTPAGVPGEATGGLTQQSILGTPQYMAPEQRESPAAVDHRADIYSLGVVLYEMLTGERPGATLEAPSKRVQIDVRLDEIVLRALEARPELRYQSAGDFKTRVESFTSGAAAPRAAQEPAVQAASTHSIARGESVGGLFLLALGMLAVVGFPFMGGVVSSTDGAQLMLVYLGAVFVGLAFPGIPVYYSMLRQAPKRTPMDGEQLRRSQLIGILIGVVFSVTMPLWQMYFKSDFFVSSFGQHSFLVFMGMCLVQLIPLGLGVIHRAAAAPPPELLAAGEPSPRAIRGRGLVVTPEQLETFWGQLMMHHCQGEFVLDDRCLSIRFRRTLSPEHVTEILLASILDVSVGRYPAMVNWMGLDRVIVTYDTGRGIAQVFLTPSLDGWASLGDVNRNVSHWCELLRAAREGRPVAVVPRSTVSHNRNRNWVLATLFLVVVFVAGVWLVTATPVPVISTPVQSVEVR